MKSKKILVFGLATLATVMVVGASFGSKGLNNVLGGEAANKRTPCELTINYENINKKRDEDNVSIHYIQYLCFEYGEQIFDYNHEKDFSIANGSYIALARSNEYQSKGLYGFMQNIESITITKSSYPFGGDFAFDLTIGANEDYADDKTVKFNSKDVFKDNRKATFTFDDPNVWGNIKGTNYFKIGIVEGDARLESITIKSSY